MTLTPRLDLKMPFMHLSLKHAEQQQEGGQKIKFVNPNTDNYEENIYSCAMRGLPMPKQGMLGGRTVVVCGSGPSLKDPEVLRAITQARLEEDAVIFACKAAIKFLAANDLCPDYGVSMDPGAHIADPRKIFKVGGITHIIASTSDPELFDYLLGPDYGPPSTVWVFHSACGFNKLITDAEYDALPDERKIYYVSNAGDGYHTSEQLMYEALFPDHAVMGGGFNVVNRAVSLADYMGAGKIFLAGVDSGWRDGADFYVDGPAHRPGVDMSDKGIVDGTNWNTRPDMLASAVAMAKLAKKQPGRFVFLGDTLPAVLFNKEDEFLDQVASF